jgi:hypothetical protein
VLFGPGGVVAVVLGGWGLWWLVTRDDQLGARGRWPAIVALAAAILAFVEWSWLAEPVSLMSEALQHRGLVRAEHAARVPGPFWAGLRGLAVGWALLAVGAAWAHRAVRGEAQPKPVDRPAAVAAVFAALAGAAGLLLVTILSPQLLDDDPRTWVAAREAVQLTSWVGLPIVWVSLAASLVGAARSRLGGA